MKLFGSKVIQKQEAAECCTVTSFMIRFHRHIRGLEL